MNNKDLFDKISKSKIIKMYVDIYFYIYICILSGNV